MKGWKRLRLLLVLGALLVSAVASANGRFPRAQRLVEDAERPERLALYGTYGLLTTTDAGQSWQYICEGATGSFSGEAPLLELLPEGRLVLSSETSLQTSSFPACDWQPLLEPAQPSAVQDITRDAANPSGLWALLSEPEVNVGYLSALSRSLDAGASWSASTPLPSELITRSLTIDSSPSRPERLYVSGLDPDGSGALLRSDDSGESWVSFPIPGTSSDVEPYIAAIAPEDEDVVYVRTSALADYQGQLQPDDALLYSADGGETFTRVLSRRAKLLGFALSPDGETLLLGYGDPVLFAYTIEPEQVGLYRLRTAELAADPEGAAAKLEQIFAGSVTCLRWTAQSLYACVAQAERGFELGRTDDAEFSLDDAEPFEALLDLRRVLPLECSADSSAAACLTDPSFGWPFVCDKLGADCNYGQAGAAGAAGAGPLDPEPVGAARDEGCACRAMRTRDSSLLSTALLAILIGCARARRRLDTKAR
jgi:photosystem II stability/assembly factor-like uncharacterized protein